MPNEEGWRRLTAAVTLMVTRPGSSNEEVVALVGGVVHTLLAQLYEKHQAALISLEPTQAVRRFLELYLPLAEQIMATGYYEASRCAVAIEHLPAPAPSDVQDAGAFIMSSVFHQMGTARAIALRGLLIPVGDQPTTLYAVSGQLGPALREAEALHAAGPDTHVYEVSIRRIQ